jgi:Tfp pilus assembly protein PilF
MRCRLLILQEIRKTLVVFLLVASLAGCAKDHESPLGLPAAAEPSAKLHNDLGISHYHASRYMDALLQFMQAYSADKQAGEIHFNIALAFHKRGKSEKALEHFKLARKFAHGNEKILTSQLLNKYLNREDK